MQGAEAQYQLLNSVGANLTGPNADMYQSQAGIAQLAQQDKALALNRVQNNFMLNYWYAMLEFFQKRLDKDMQAKAKQ